MALRRRRVREARLFAASRPIGTRSRQELWFLRRTRDNISRTLDSRAMRLAVIAITDRDRSEESKVPHLDCRRAAAHSRYRPGPASGRGCCALRRLRRTMAGQPNGFVLCAPTSQKPDPHTVDRRAWRKHAGASRPILHARDKVMHQNPPAGFANGRQWCAMPAQHRSANLLGAAAATGAPLTGRGRSPLPRDTTPP